MNKKATAILSYLGLICWLIAYLAGDKENAKFDLNQGLVLALANIICSVCGSMAGRLIPFGSVIFWILSIVIFVFMVMGLVNACKGEEKELPLIGGIKILK